MPDGDPLRARPQAPLDAVRGEEHEVWDGPDLLERICHVHIFTFEMLPGGERRSLFSGPHLDRLMGGPVPEGRDHTAEWIAMIHPEDLHALDDHIERNRRGKLSEVQYRLRGYDGVTRWLCARTVPRAAEDRVIYDGVVWEVSEQKSAEAALLASQERLRTLVANVPGVVFRLAPGERWRADFVSDAMGVMFGFEATEFTSVPPRRALSDLVDPTDLDAVVAARKSAMEGSEYAVEYRLVDAAGDVRWVYEHGQAILDDQGGAPWVDGVIFDITDRKNAERELERMEVELRLAQKLEAVGQLAAGVAHEINTPIQFVGDSIGFLEGAFRDTFELIGAYRAELRNAEPSVREAIVRAEDEADIAYVEERAPIVFERIRNGIERVATLVKAMKDFAHPGGSGMQPADVNEALQSTVTVAHSEYKDYADVELDLEELPPVVCNIGELGQVFLNLLVNAAHAIEAFHGAAGRRGTIRITSRLEGQIIVVTVADDGCGIPVAVRDRIFDPFFTTKEVGRGTGQGLAITHSIVVDHHGGAIACDSAPGEGTTFTITLPARVADGSSGEQLAA